MVRTLRRATTTVVVVASFTMLLAATIWSYANATRLSADLVELRTESARDALLVQHLSYHVRSQSLDGPEFLAGMDAVADTAVSMRHPTDGVYYLTSPDCPWTPRGYPVLTEIANRGIPVIGVALADDRQSLREHLAAYALPNLVIAAPSGSLFDAIPKYGSPFLVAVRDGRIVAFRAGVLQSSDVAFLDDALNAAVGETTSIQ